MSYSKKIVALIPTALAAILYTLSYAAQSAPREAERAFRSFSVRLNQRQYAAAERGIERAVSLSPESAYYLAGRGLLLVRTSQRRFDPASFVEKRLTLSEEELKALDAAARYYRRALELNPADDGNHHNLGWVHALLRQRAEALHHFRRAISIDGSIALYHISLGLLHEQDGANEEASREYETAVRLSPSVLDSQFFRDLGHRSGATADRVVRGSIAHLEAQSRQARNPILKGKLGKLYLHQNLPEQASAALREALAELPSLPRPWHNLGDVYGRQGDEAAMADCYRRATFLDGSDAVAWAKLGGLHERRNNKLEAIHSYERAVGGWMGAASEHAGRASRIYRARFVVSDDILPNGFLSYCNPSLDVSEVCLRLARLYDEAGDGGRASYYKDLSVGLTF